MRMLLASLAFLVVVGSVAIAGEANEVADLRNQVNALSERLANLEGAAGEGTPWADRISWGGSFRYRHEMVKDESKAHENHLHRIQAKVKLTANVTDNVDVIFQLASGSDSNTSATSTNQTEDTSFSTKAINLDLAYFQWKPGAVTALGGKMKNPFFKPGKTELIWDGDITPEGLAVQYSKAIGAATLFANLGGFSFDHRSGDAPPLSNAVLAAAQAGAKLKVDDNTSVTVGGSYYDFGAMKGKAPINAKNNTTTGGLYDEDFDLLEAFVEVGTKVGKYPVAVFGDYVVNAGSDASNDSGYLVGFTLGKCKDPGSKAFRYNYRRVEANAVVGGINDSDFADGGTDGQGHELGFDYQVAKNVKAGVTYFNNDKKMSGSKDDYERVQLDIKFKF